MEILTDDHIWDVFRRQGFIIVARVGDALFMDLQLVISTTIALTLQVKEPMRMFGQLLSIHILIIY